VLSEAHYIDRFEEALRTAERLGARLERAAERRGGSADLAAMLALRLHVIGRALEGLDEDAPDELFVRIRPGGHEREGAFAARLAAMYAGWAQRRGMECRRVAEDGAHVLLVGGLGAAVVLAPERGLHVFEAHEGAARITAAVEVAARPPSTVDERDLAGLAERCLRNGAGGTTIVRRYRDGTAPLVRDSVRGYRTGRLDQVLAGDFDLF
jgi:ATP-dependent Clp protease ATP-binding subunit ClpC